MPRDTAEETKVKHAKVVEYAKANWTSQAATEMNAIAHGYSQNTIRSSLADAGLRPKGSRPGVQDSALQIVALWQRNIRQCDIVADLNVTRQYMSAVISRARKAAINGPA
ncbi:MAG: hypothetical protein WBD31_02955 [Rubripirellula sp.]